jgi:hypothetical protein
MIEWIREMDWADRTMAAVAVVCCGAVVFGIAILAFAALGPKPKTFELVVAEWSCTDSHEERTTTLVMVGKVPVTNVHTNTICDRWERK